MRTAIVRPLSALGVGAGLLLAAAGRVVAVRIDMPSAPDTALPGGDPTLELLGAALVVAALALGARRRRGRERGTALADQAHTRSRSSFNRATTDRHPLGERPPDGGARGTGGSG